MRGTCSLCGGNQRRWIVKVYDASGDLVDTVQGVVAATRKIAKRKVSHGSWKPWMKDCHRAGTITTLAQRGFKITATPEGVEYRRKMPL